VVDVAIIRLTIEVRATPEQCFDAARDIGIHSQTVWPFTRERAVPEPGYVSQGLIGLGEKVIFEAVHFGLRQRLTAVITEFEYPTRFVDVMEKGAFRSLCHTHLFEKLEVGTTMTDILEYRAPVGWLGSLFDWLILRHYMRAFLRYRQTKLKEYIECGEVTRGKQ
jgi:ligand-binding SRPBCC domain-containing protein